MTSGTDDAAPTNEEGRDGSPSLPGCIARNEDGSYTLQLASAIKVEGETRSSLTLKRLQAKHLMRLDEQKGEMAKAVMLVALSAGIPFAAARELDADDLADAGAVINDFLQTPRLAGAKGQR